MHLRSIVFCTLALTLLPGCLSTARPTQKEREEASARATKALAAHHSKLQRAAFVLLACSHPASFDFSSNGDSFHFKKVAPDTIGGLATAISEDGYLLTAAHATGPYCYVAGWMDGKPAASPARVVYKRQGILFGEDFAILHADKHLDYPVQLGTPDSARSDIYALACSRWPCVQIIPVAGKVLHSPELNSSNGLSIMTAELPLWRGDSGTGILSEEGKLVGVFVGVSGSSWMSFRGFRVACAPDPDFVQSIVEADRCRSTSR